MRIIAVFLVLALVGCAPSPKRTALPADETKQTWQQHQQQINATPHWSAKGRLAVTQGKKGGNASFVWQQIQDRFQIKLHGPFGSGAVMITGNSRHVQAKEANGKSHQANSPEQLMQQLAGWQVPISGLQYWIRGIPVPQMPASNLQFNGDGLLKQFNQDGWTIHYDEYVLDKCPLPKRILLHNAKLKVKLIVTSWGA